MMSGSFAIVERSCLWLYQASFAARRAYLQENQGSWTSCRLTKIQSADTFVCTAMISDVALKYGRTCRNHNRDSLPASRKRRPNDDLMLYQRRRHWSNIYKYWVNISLLLGSHKMSLVSQNIWNPYFYVTTWLIPMQKQFKIKKSH